jgi:hypothetical protein
MPTDDRLNRRTARLALAAVTAAIFIGTLVPGPWKNAVLAPLQTHLDAAAIGHVVLFAVFAFVLRRGLGLTGAAVVAAGLALGLVTEGLQFFAIERHPEWRGVAQDLAGSVLGWLLGRWAALRSSRRRDQSRPGVSTQR